MKTSHHTMIRRSIFPLSAVSLLLAASLACASVAGGLKPASTATSIPLTATPPLPPAAKPTIRSTATKTIEANIWTSVGPEGGEITVLVIDPATPTTLYAGINVSGVFKSTNSGGNWTAINTGLTDSTVGALAIDPTSPATLYAGTYRSGIFRSTNGGENWSAINTELINHPVQTLMIDPVTPTTLYAVIYPEGLFKSVNSGLNWIAINNGLGDGIVSALVIDPASPGTLYAGTESDGVFKSTNSGGNWSATNTGLTNTSISSLVIDPLTSSTLYAGTWDGGVFKSTNGGVSWSAVNRGLIDTQVLTIAIDPTWPTTLYAGTGNGGVFKSTNGGGNWNAFNSGLTNTNIKTLAIDPLTPTTLYAGTVWNGIFVNRVNRSVVSATPHSPPRATASPVPAHLDWKAVMDAFAEDSVKNTPMAGMTLAIRRQGEPDWIQGYGFADLEESIPASPDTVYQIGSLSMQFTAAAVMQLNEQGRLDLNAPISQYLDGLPETLQSFTLHQLLTHTSLIYDSPFDIQDKFLSQQEFTSETLLQELVPKLNVSSNDVPDMFSYGNYILAGLIVEKVSGLSYPDYLNQYVIASAGLKHTSYCEPPPAALAHNYYLPENRFEPLDINISAVFAAGGLCSTAGDLLLWMDALTSGEVVTLDSYQQMITPAKLPDGSPGFFGYGLYVLPDQNGLQIGYLGGEVSNVSYLISYPENGPTIVLLSNTAKLDNDLFIKLQANIPILMP